MNIGLSTPTSSSLHRGLRLALFLGVALVISYYALLHYQVLQIEHPITQDEPGFIEITAAGNAYTWANVQVSANVYGPIYALWARPFTSLFSNPYIAHRWANSVALFLSLGLLGWLLRREGTEGAALVAGLAIFYALNVSSHSLAASADFLGMMFYLGALAVSRRNTWPALLLGLGLTLLGALSKPYFGLSAAIIASHRLLFCNRRDAIAYIGMGGVIAAVTAALLQWIAPYYFFSTFVVHQNAAARNAGVLLRQSAEFALLTVGVIVLALLCRPLRRALTFSSQRPLISPAIDLWDWGVIVSGSILLVSLGWHPGNYLVYYYHLLLGPLVMVALRHLRDWPRLGYFLLCANIAVLGFLLPALPGNDHWADLASSVRAEQGPVLADPLLEPFTHAQPHIELLSHGQTAAVFKALDQLGSAVPTAYVPLHQALLRGAENQNRRIRAQEFSAIYISYHEIASHRVWSYDQGHLLKTLFAYYEPTGEILIYPYATPYWDRLLHGAFAYHVTRWIPKRSLPTLP